VPHRRGSFHEDWNDLLIRFAHRGTPAAIEDELRQAKVKMRGDRLPAFDFHKELFERSRG
jgi:hypothetical protein